MAPSLHLSDSQIDDYWTGRLADADAKHVELHYMECAQCRERVGAVETLVDALRLDRTPAASPALSRHAWQRLAAVLAIVVIGATWQWSRQAGVGEAPQTAAVQGDEPSTATFTVAVEPPTRGALATEVRVPPGVSIVVFDLDAREAGAPGTMFDVSLIGARGRSIMRVQTRSSDAGRIELPIHRSLLEPGPLQFEITREGATIALPIVMQESNQRR